MAVRPLQRNAILSKHSASAGSKDGTELGSSRARGWPASKGKTNSRVYPDKIDGGKKDGGRNGARSMVPSRGQGPLTPRTRALGKGTAPTAMAEGTPAGRRTALRREVPAGWAKPEAGGDGVHEPRGS